MSMPHPEFTLHDLLRNCVERDPGKVAVVDGSAEHTYESLERASNYLSAALVESGVKKGDRVGVYMEKSWEAVVAMLAASRIGAAYVNINPLFKPPQVAYVAQDCDVRVMIGDSAKLDELEPGMVSGTAFYKGERPGEEVAGHLTDLAEVLRGGAGDALRAERLVSEVDLATILYTSGSTGMPKGVATSQRNVVVGAQIVSTYLENTPQDRILSALPLNFDAGMSQFMTSLRVGATLVLQRSRLPGDLSRGLRRHEITGVTGVPPLWALLLRSARAIEEEPLENLRYIANTGGRIPQANLDELERLLEPSGTKIYLMYGLTEAFRLTYLPPEEVERGSTCIGKAIPNTEILVINKEGRECAPDEPGELVHRGPTVAMGYWGNEEATLKAYRPNPLAPPELLDVEQLSRLVGRALPAFPVYHQDLGVRDGLADAGGAAIHLLRRQVRGAERLGEPVHQVDPRPRRLQKAPELVQVGLRYAPAGVGYVAQALERLCFDALCAPEQQRPQRRHAGDARDLVPPECPRKVARQPGALQHQCRSYP